mmetsp:Transcript_60192/g.173638  ORF Transcript_60192/g.173638 Transcript_60192/m.173638 type:complete len:204 (+) Transcript_60192:868-1479(+)
MLRRSFSTWLPPGLSSSTGESSPAAAPGSSLSTLSMMSNKSVASCFRSWIAAASRCCAWSLRSRTWTRTSSAAWTRCLSSGHRLRCFGKDSAVTPKPSMVGATRRCFGEPSLAASVKSLKICLRTRSAALMASHSTGTPATPPLAAFCRISSRRSVISRNWKINSVPFRFRHLRCKTIANRHLRKCTRARRWAKTPVRMKTLV